VTVEWCSIREIAGKNLLTDEWQPQPVCQRFWARSLQRWQGGAGINQLTLDIPEDVGGLPSPPCALMALFQAGGLWYRASDITDVKIIVAVSASSGIGIGLKASLAAIHTAIPSPS
jgi:hypothetical protein